ncbi:class I SAM-dependent methyltransferase [Fictibacillus enclensis]|uniref:class I SAM-dependent methyltransferase n=1 Tax=Fictibacillus enclensis TaxID=1017270 RepID=UPI0024C046D6|nr:class I SAM-dependent methyltransferase [Fictibacillus enclensis]WHY71359.1 methyltransferase domain-containing protein [Fictibacillus enclensis]
MIKMKGEGSMDIKAKVQEQFGKNADNYITSPIHAKGKDLELMVMLSNATAQDRVLDIATGGGHTSNAFSPHVKEVTALDLTSEILVAAKQFINEQGRNNVSFVQGDAENLPFEKESFELVTCRIAPHHFPDVKAFVSEAFRVLVPGGRFLLIDNTAPEILEYDQFYNHVEKRRDPSHYRAWKKSEWLQLFEETGFTFEQMHAFKKDFAFDSWCSRMQLASKDKEELENDMLSASERVKEYFMIKEKEGHVQAFTGDAVFIIARK